LSLILSDKSTQKIMSSDILIFLDDQKNNDKDCLFGGLIAIQTKQHQSTV